MFYLDTTLTFDLLEMKVIGTFRDTDALFFPYNHIIINTI